jgi:hypothetical protein
LISCVFVSNYLCFLQTQDWTHMNQEEIIKALFTLIKPENETTEDVFYNAGVIDAIKKVQALAAGRSNENLR